MVTVSYMNHQSRNQIIVPLYNFYTYSGIYIITETALNGIRVTLKNTGNLLFAQAVTVYATTVSNTAIVTATTAQAGSNGGLVLGTSAPTYANDNNIGQYMTTFANITSGTTTTTTAAVTAVNTIRTGW